MNKKTEWNDGYIHEGADRCHVVMSLISDILVDHPAIVKAELQGDINNTLDSLMHCYQTIWQLEEDLEVDAKNLEPIERILASAKKLTW